MSDLSVASRGTVFRSTRVILPLSLRHKAVALGHGAAHFGITDTKRRLRAVVGFPGLDAHVETFVSIKCQLCVSADPGNTAPLERSTTQPLALPLGRLLWPPPTQETYTRGEV